jgi:hypothetical protein
MRKLITASLLAVMLLAILAGPSFAGGRRGHHWRGHHWHGGSRVFIGVGPRFWYGPYAHPYWYYSPYYVYTPPTVVVQEPPVYVQQDPAPAAPPAPAESFWYYCPSAKEYYPRVPNCSEAWIKVPPRQD